jgi:hypothetical protein
MMISPASEHRREARHELSKTLLLDDRLSLLIPASFKLMPEQLRLSKYPGANSPPIAFSNTNGTVSIAINHTNVIIANDDLPHLLGQLRRGVEHAHPEVEWTNSCLLDREGRTWIQMEFVTQGLDDKIRNLMIATSYAGRMLSIAFNVVESLSGEWLSIGNAMIESASLRES